MRWIPVAVAVSATVSIPSLVEAQGEETGEKPAASVEDQAGSDAGIRLVDAVLLHKRRAFRVGLALTMTFWTLCMVSSWAPEGTPAYFSSVISVPVMLIPQLEYIAMLRGLGIEPSQKARVLLGMSLACAIAALAGTTASTIIIAEYRIRAVWEDDTSLFPSSYPTSWGNRASAISYGVALSLGLASWVMAWHSAHLLQQQLYRVLGWRRRDEAEDGNDTEVSILPRVESDGRGVSVGVMVVF